MPPVKNPVNVRISDAVMEGIEEHAYSSLTAEVGGMLMGSVRGKTTAIEGFIPALSASQEQVTLTFTHDVWEEILTRAAKEFPDKIIVGWYHTHPTFGVFLSEYDLFIQDNFFANRGNVALVIDPVQGELGWFAKDESGKVVSFNEGPTQTGPKRSVDPIGSVELAKGSKAKVAAAAGAGVIIGGMIGAGVMFSQIPPDLTPALQGSQQQTLQSQRDLLALEENISEIFQHPVLSYQVKAGDTLTSIAGVFYRDVSYGRWVIAEVNGLDMTSDLPVGLRLAIPQPSSVTLEPYSAEQLLEGLSLSPLDAPELTGGEQVTDELSDEPETGESTDD